MLRSLCLATLLVPLLAGAPALADDPGFHCSWKDIQVREGFVLPARDVAIERPWLKV
jgi:hypothetical protein